jgi:hypothetical protein
MPRIERMLQAVATGLTIAIAVRVILGPDGSRTLIMKCASGSEDFCQRQAELWASLADKAQTVYNQARLTTV